MPTSSASESNACAPVRVRVAPSITSGSGWFVSGYSWTRWTGRRRYAVQDGPAPQSLSAGLRRARAGIRRQGRGLEGRDRRGHGQRRSGQRRRRRWSRGVIRTRVRVICLNDLFCCVRDSLTSRRGHGISGLFTTAVSTVPVSAIAATAALSKGVAVVAADAPAAAIAARARRASPVAAATVALSSATPSRSRLPLPAPPLVPRHVLRVPLPRRDGSLEGRFPVARCPEQDHDLEHCAVAAHVPNTRTRAPRPCQTLIRREHLAAAHRSKPARKSQESRARAPAPRRGLRALVNGEARRRNAECVRLTQCTIGTRMSARAVVRPAPTRTLCSVTNLCRFLSTRPPITYTCTDAHRPPLAHTQARRRSPSCMPGAYFRGVQHVDDICRVRREVHELRQRKRCLERPRRHRDCPVSHACMCTLCALQAARRRPAPARKTRQPVQPSRHSVRQPHEMNVKRLR